MPEFNLIDEPWIPCIDLKGDKKEHSILETFSRAHELSEIHDDSPLVTVSIYRLLLAILYRAYDGPRDFFTLVNLWDKGKFDLGDLLSAYLNKWHDRFYLVSSTYPFCQMAELKMDKPVSVNRLSTACSSGNNPTLFDHSQDELKVDWPPSKVTRELLACQSFALGFGKSGKANINGIEEVLPYFADAIALRGMIVWLQANNLFESLLLNLSPLDSDDTSLPAWEHADTNLYRDRVIDGKRVQVKSFGKVDRLIWQSRLIKLLPEAGRFSMMYFTQGRSADKGIGDPMKVYRLSKSEGVSAVPLSSYKAAWRDSHSLLMIPTKNSGEERPECFNLAARLEEQGYIDFAEKVVIHVVGLATKPGDAGKFLLWRHDRFPFPNNLLNDSNLIGQIGQLLEKAENVAKELQSRTYRMAILILPPGSDRKELKKLQESLDPCPSYWSRLEKHFFLLLEMLPGDWDYDKDDWKPDEQQAALINWHTVIKVEAQRALEESVVMLGTTAKAIQAVARVRTVFNDRDLEGGKFTILPEITEKEG